MNLKECKNGIINEFPLKDWKHKSGIQGGYFQTDTEYLRYDFSYGITNYIDEFHVGWAACITFKEVEKILIESKLIDAKKAITMCMMDTSPDYFNGSRSIDYVVKSEIDIKSMYNTIGSFLNLKAIDFFNKFQTISDLDSWYNKTLGQPVLYSSPLVRFNSQTGIIAAKLNNNPKYNELIKEYRQLQKGEHFAYEFEQVVDYLDKYYK